MRDGAPVVYSIGTDRDDDDAVRAPGRGPWKDGGQWLPPDQVGNAPDGDWILWPRPRTPLERLDR